MVRQREIKFRPHQCPSCRYFKTPYVSLYKGHCMIRGSHAFLMDSSNRDCKNYENLEAYERGRMMVKVKCCHCGEEEEHWERAKSLGWLEENEDGKYTCGGCERTRRDQGKNMHYHKYVKQGHRW